MSEAEVAKAAEVDPNVVNLSKKVQAHGVDVDKLTFREPIGRDLNATGIPFTMDEKGSTDIKAPAMSALIARLADVPPSTVASLGVNDWMMCAAKVMDFFGGQDAAPLKK